MSLALEANSLSAEPQGKPVCAHSLQLCLILCNPMGYSPISAPVHGVLQARNQSSSPFPPPGDLPNPGIELSSLMSPALAGEFFTTSAAWEAYTHTHTHIIYLFSYIYYIYYVYVLSQYGLLQDIEYTFLYTIVGPGYLSILCVFVHICQSPNPNLSLPNPISPLVTKSLFSMSVRLFLFCK